jgi:hypothetical protein
MSSPPNLAKYAFSPTFSPSQGASAMRAKSEQWTSGGKEAFERVGHLTLEAWRCGWALSLVRETKIL